MGRFLGLMDQPIQQALVSALNMAALAAGLIVLSLIVVILIDVPFQLWNNAKQLRMTKEEVKQEHKDSEGDPPCQRAYSPAAASHGARSHDE